MNEDLIKISVTGDSRSLVSAVKEGVQALELMERGYSKVNDAIDRANEKSKKIGKAMFGAGVGIELAMAANVKSAADFESRMNNVYTIVDRNNAATKSWEQDLLSLSTTFPTSANNLAEGLYEINSSGVSAADSMQVLEASSRAAAAGLTGTETSAYAITAAMNAYGMGVEDASYISDILFATVDKGVISFEELGQNIGDWVSSAAAAKVPIDDAGAALATMTLAGINAAESSTALKSVFQSFIKPSEDMTTAVAELGYETPLAMIEVLGLKGSIDTLNESAKGNPTALSGMFNNIRALNGVLALTSGSGENYNRVFAEMSDRTKVAGSTQRAYAEQSKSFSVQMEVLKNSFTAFRIEMGTYLLPIMKQFASIATNIIGIYGNLPEPIKKAIAYLTAFSGVILMLGGVFLMSAAKLTVFNYAIGGINSRLGTSIPKIVSLTGAVTKAALSFGSSLPFIGQYISKIQGSVSDTKMMTGALTGVAGVLAIGLYAWSGYGNAIDKARKSAKDFAQTQADTVEDPFDTKGQEAAMDNFSERIAELTIEKEKLSDDSFSWRGWGNEVDEAFSIVTGNGVPLSNLNAELEELEKQRDLFERRSKYGAQNAEHYAENLGITTEEVKLLADALGEDLGKYREIAWDWPEKLGLDFEKMPDSLDPFENSLRDMAIAMESGAYETDILAEQMDNLGGLMQYAEDGTLELSEAQKVLEGALESVATSSSLFDAALEAKKSGMREYGEQAVKMGRATEEEITEKVDAAKLSLLEYAEVLAQQNEDLRNWRKNLVEISRVAGDDVATYLAAMGEEGVGLVAEMADGTEEEMIRMSAAIVDNMSLTGAQAAIELDAGMKIAQEAGRQGAKATVDSIATELGMLPEDVERISAEYGLALNSGLSPVMSVLGLKINDALGLGSKMSSYSGTYGSSGGSGKGGAGYFPDNSGSSGTGTGGSSGGYQFFENADGALPREATFQLGQRVQWAEPETEGEWFIPKAKSKRGRSEAILEDAASEFGFGLVKFARGGFLGASIPGPPSGFKAKGSWGDHTKSELQGAFEVASRVSEMGRRKQDEIDRLRSMTQGSSTGLNKVFLEQYEAYNRARGNKFHIISGWRSTAKQAVLYAKYLAGTGNLAARPGTSNHERGLAIDHGPHSTAADRAVARQFRLHYPVRGEPWHVEPFADGGFLSGFKAAQAMGMPTGVFDNGGVLQEGWNATYNGTGAPEKLVRVNSGSDSGGGVTYAPVIDLRVEGGQSPEEFRKVLEKELVPALESQYQKFAAMSNRKERST